MKTTEPKLPAGEFNLHPGCTSKDIEGEQPEPSEREETTHGIGEDDHERELWERHSD